MAKYFFTLAKAIVLFAISATSGTADQQRFIDGTPLTIAQLGHVFDIACIATLPVLMERRARIVEDAFAFEAIDLGTDAGWISPNGAITLTVDGTALKATCEMSIVADVVGDGEELYNSIESHLSEHLEGNLPTATYIDGGLSWEWDGQNASFTLTFYQVEGAYGISLTSEG